MAEQIVTDDTIASAKAHQAAERAKVYAMTGLRVVDDGPVYPYTIICPRCLTPVGGDNEGKATRSLGRHLVTAHVRQEHG